MRAHAHEGDLDEAAAAEVFVIHPRSARTQVRTNPLNHEKRRFYAEDRLAHHCRCLEVDYPFLAQETRTSSAHKAYLQQETLISWCYFGKKSKNRILNKDFSCKVSVFGQISPVACCDAFNPPYTFVSARAEKSVPSSIQTTMKSTNHKMTKRSAQVAVLALFGLACSSANAALIRIGPGSFTPQASVITFSEIGYPLGTTNPVYVVSTASLGSVTVSFAGYFQGQSVTGGAVVTLNDTTPTGPLSLDMGTGNPAVIAADGANPTSPVLSGTPTFNGPIAVLFSTPVAAVGLDGGYFDAIGATSIEAFAPDGTSLGIVTNTAIGIEFFGLADSSGGNVIGGISFYITGNEPAGFAIDNLTFGSFRETTIIPETGNVAAVGLLIASGLVLRKRRTRA